jgi:acyltransferase
MTTEPSRRITWIDTLKGIGVTLVILGHTVGVPQSVLQLIFACHIPLFFWMSGLVGTGKVTAMPTWPYLLDRMQRRLIPYLGFALISYLAWALFLRFVGTRQTEQLALYIPLVGILYGSSVKGYLAPNVVLWFFPCLFVTEILFYFLVKIRSAKLLVIALLICSGLGYYYTANFSFRFPWGADIALTAVVFYGVGYLSRQYLRGRTVSWAIFGGALCFSLVMYVTFAFYNTPVAMIIGNYGDNYAAFYLAAFTGIGFWAMGANLLSSFRVLRIVGQHTLVLFSLHLLVFPFITAFFLYVWRLPADFREQSVIYAIIYTIISIIVLIPASLFLEKYFPWLVGKVKKQDNQAFFIRQSAV